MNGNSEWFFQTVNGVSAVFGILMGGFAVAYPIHSRFDRSLGGLQLLLGFYFGARWLGHAEIEHFMLPAVLLLVFIFFTRLFEIRTTFSLRVSLLTVALVLMIGGLVIGIENSVIQHVGLLGYEAAVFGALWSLAYRQSRLAKHDYERKLKQGLCAWSGASFVFLAGDRLSEMLWHTHQISGLLFIPLTHWVLYLFKHSGVRSYASGVRASLAELGAFAFWLVVVLGAGFHQGISLSFQVIFESIVTFLLFYLGAKAIELRMSLSEGFGKNSDESSREAQGSSLSEQELLGMGLEQLPERLARQKAVKSARWVSAVELKQLRAEQIVDELNLRATPLFRPTSMADWVEFQQLPEWRRDLILFVFDALKSDCLMYSATRESVLAVDLNGFGFAAESEKAFVSLFYYLRLGALPKVEGLP